MSKRDRSKKNRVQKMFGPKNFRLKKLWVQKTFMTRKKNMALVLGYKITTVFFSVQQTLFSSMSEK